MTEQCPCCTAAMNGSDHCPECGCEEWEMTCDMEVPGAWQAASDAHRRAAATAEAERADAAA